MIQNYLIGVCELDLYGNIMGEHHVSSTVADSIEAAKEWAINDTACDWGYDLEDVSDLHVLFVMATPVGTGIEVLEYEERVVI